MRAVSKKTDAIFPAADQSQASLQVLSLGEFLAKEIPSRECILSPWLLKGSINLIYAMAGTGKSLFCMKVAIAAACGHPFLHWTSPRPYKVLYVDGEMHPSTLKSRFNLLMDPLERQLANQNLKVLTTGLQANGIPDLASDEGQQAISPFLVEPDLIIFDNLSSLVSGTQKENDAEYWNPIQKFANPLRSAGKCIIFVHHCSKSNAQRGTNKKEDAADVVLQLNPKSNSEGACFTMNFLKSRELYGSDIKQATLAMVSNSSNQAQWKRIDSVKPGIQDVVARMRQGLSRAQVIEQLGLDKCAVSRLLTKAFKAELITPQEAEAFGVREAQGVLRSKERKHRN